MRALRFFAAVGLMATVAGCSGDDDKNFKDTNFTLAEMCRGAISFSKSIEVDEISESNGKYQHNSKTYDCTYDSYRQFFNINALKNDRESIVLLGSDGDSFTLLRTRTRIERTFNKSDFE